MHSCPARADLCPEAQFPVCLGEEGETDNEIQQLLQSMGFGVETAVNRKNGSWRLFKREGLVVLYN